MSKIEQKELESTKGWGIFDKIQVIESKGIKTIFVKGQQYMSWDANDQISQRVAISQLYKVGLSTQEELSDIFGIHVNTIYSYINNFESDGVKGLVSERSGPKQQWKIVPEVRGKILMTLLIEGIKEYSAIQKRLKQQ